MERDSVHKVQLLDQLWLEAFERDLGKAGESRPALLSRHQAVSITVSSQFRLFFPASVLEDPWDFLIYEPIYC
jgi:hypothetical protein